MTSPRGTRAIQAVVRTQTHLSAVEQLMAWARVLRAWWLRRVRWSVTVTSRDRLYDVAHRWLSEIAADEPPRAVDARLEYGHGMVSESGPMTPTPAAVALYYDIQRQREVVIDGHRVTVQTRQSQGDDDDMRKAGSGRGATETIVFHAQTAAGQRAVVRHLESLVASASKRKPALFLLTSWGEWRRRDDLPVRPIESVVLPTGQMERIRDDVARFLDSEAEYVRRGQPWHRGYLLEGPPGTGKTSLIRALSAHFSLDLWYVPLGDVRGDASLLTLFSQVGARSLLLLEDVDVFHATRERTDSDDRKASMAGLLNALDGVVTPHGLIVVMTTNDASVIDPALLRPGRVDVREMLAAPAPEQTCRLWAQYFGLDPEVGLAYVERIRPAESTAAVIEVCKSSTDGADALARLCAEPDRPSVWSAYATPVIDREVRA